MRAAAELALASEGSDIGDASFAPLDVLIPANGHGNRLRSRTGGSPKAVLPVDGHPLILRLIAGVSLPSVRAITVLAPPGGSARIAEALQEMDLQVPLEIVTEHPSGYLADVVRHASARDGAVLVSDGDLYFDTDDMAALVARAATLPADTDALLAITADTNNPQTRGIPVRPIKDSSSERVEVIARGQTSRWSLVGAYAFRGPLMAQRANELPSSGSFAEFLVAMSSVWTMHACKFRYVRNINTPSDYDALRVEVPDLNSASGLQARLQHPGLLAGDGPLDFDPL